MWIPEEKDRNPEVCSYIQSNITNSDDLITALRDSSGAFHVASVHTKLDFQVKIIFVSTQKAQRTSSRLAKRVGYRDLSIPALLV